MPQRVRHLQALYRLTAALSGAGALDEIYEAALHGLQHALAIERASILLFDPDGVMRFKAWRGLSAQYRSATEGHTPWSPATKQPQPVLVPDVVAEPGLAPLRDVICEEGIRALAFVPLVHHGQLLGKFMLYYSTPHQFTNDEIQLAQSISDHIAVAVARRQAEEALHSSEQRLALAYQAAQEAIRVRDQFLSIATHELKTPLTSLLGYAQLLQQRAERESGLNERDRRALQVIVEQAARLNKMILALLDISRIETGQLSIERKPMDLSALVRRVVEQSYALLDQHRLQLNCPNDPLMIMGDELRLEQVLQNLVSNAVKYSLNGGAVQIQVERQHDTARIIVADQGMGIPATDLPHLFERFYRAGNAGKHHINGMGIGLYIVKEIVSLHGGTVTVESVEGRGSTFSVCLPRYISSEL